MLVKKMPIYQGFPDFETVKKLSGLCLKMGCEKPVFYDIETTGLSRNSTFLYLIGAISYEENGWQITQWFGENEADEADILKSFAEFLKSYTCIISYNGERFDAPYLKERYSVHHLPFPLEEMPSLDLYLSLKEAQKFLKLARMKQPDLEEFLEYDVREHCDGKDCIKLYRKYMQTRKTDMRDVLMGHNEEDLAGLVRIFRMLGYLYLFRGEYDEVSAVFEDDFLYLTFKLPYNLPKTVSNGGGEFYLTVTENYGKMAVSAPAGRVRQYYPNYKDYDYLPAEDTAIPKALSACMDRKLKKAAKAETCYTWFDCTGAFLTNPAQQTQYLRSTLPCLLKMLK